MASSGTNVRIKFTHVESFVTTFMILHVLHMKHCLVSNSPNQILLQAPKHPAWGKWHNTTFRCLLHHQTNCFRCICFYYIYLKMPSGFMSYWINLVYLIMLLTKILNSVFHLYFVKESLEDNAFNSKRQIMQGEDDEKWVKIQDTKNKIFPFLIIILLFYKCIIKGVLPCWFFST